MTESKNEIVIDDIIKMIPHRYPLLLVDRIVDLEHDKYAVGIKNVTFNEPHFTGHFPGKPIMPGVLIIEAMAQTAAILVVETLGRENVGGKLVYFMSIDGAKFRKPVTPGDTMYIKVEKQHSHRSVWKFSAVASVNDKKVAEAIVTAMIVDNENAK